MSESVLFQAVVCRFGCVGHACALRSQRYHQRRVDNMHSRRKNNTRKWMNNVLAAHVVNAWITIMCLLAIFAISWSGFCCWASCLYCISMRRWVWALLCVSRWINMEFSLIMNGVPVIQAKCFGKSTNIIGGSMKTILIWPNKQISVIEQKSSGQNSTFHSGTTSTRGRNVGIALTVTSESIPANVSTLSVGHIGRQHLINSTQIHMHNRNWITPRCWQKLPILSNRHRRNA